jgi:hypothetical protein
VGTANSRRAGGLTLQPEHIPQIKASFLKKHAISSFVHTVAEIVSKIKPFVL